MLSWVGAECELPTVHPHMLRHSCGFFMADRHKDMRVMQDWLGHANVQNTVAFVADEDCRPGDPACRPRVGSVG
jgi:site-specific recombinase XerC